MRLAWALALLLLPAAAAQAPEQVHTSLAEGGGLMVQFATVGPLPAAAEPGVSWRTANSSWQWTAAPLAGAGHAISSTTQATLIHAAAIAIDEPPGTIIEYRVGTRLLDAQELLEPRLVALPPADRLRFVAMGDIGYDGVDDDGGGQPDSAPVRIRDLAATFDADLLVVPGDLAYDDSNPGWDRFFRFLEPLAAHMPFMPAIGNHERANDVEGYKQYLARMVLPGDEQKYTYQAGPVTFIVLNSDAICTRDTGRAAGPDPECPTGTQSVDQGVLAWLDEALALANADDTPWTVVYFHHQSYSFGRRGDDAAILKHWVPRFEAAGVDVVLAAHDHIYARSHPIVAGQRDAGAGPAHDHAQDVGPIHVIAGGGGRTLYALRDGPLPDHLAHAQRVHHLVLFDVDRDALVMRAIDGNGTTIDGFTIHRLVPAATGPSVATPAPAPWLAAVLCLAFARRTPKG